MVPSVLAANSEKPVTSRGLVSLTIRAPRIWVLLSPRKAVELLRPVTRMIPFHRNWPVWKKARSESSTTRIPLTRDGLGPVDGEAAEQGVRVVLAPDVEHRRRGRGAEVHRLVDLRGTAAVVGDRDDVWGGGALHLDPLRLVVVAAGRRVLAGHGAVENLRRGVGRKVLHELLDHPSGEGAVVIERVPAVAGGPGGDGAVGPCPVTDPLPVRQAVEILPRPGC